MDRYDLLQPELAFPSVFAIDDLTKTGLFLQGEYPV
jgi:hypothetical protein